MAIIQLTGHNTQRKFVTKTSVSLAGQPGQTRQARPAGRRLLTASLLLASLGLTACGQGNEQELIQAFLNARGQDNNYQAIAIALANAASDANNAASSGNDAPSADDTPGSGEYLNLVSKTSQDICDSILARNTPLLEGTDRHALPSTARPALGIATQEPTYGSCIVRLTNQSETRGRFHRNDYSRRQAFNADSSLMLLNAEDGYWHLYNAMTGKPIKVLKGLAGDAEPQWHPSDPRILHFLPTNGVGMKIYKLDVIDNEVTLAADMSSQIRAHWPDADTAWTRSEGSPSADGRYWCFMTEHINGGDWQARGVFTWDMQTQRIIGTKSTRVRPDHVSMSPSGKYCVISGDDQAGTRAYRRDFKTPYRSGSSAPYLQLHKKSEHSDLAFNRNKEDVYVAIDYQSDKGDIFMVNLETGVRKMLFPSYLKRTATAIHVSGKAFNKPGWVVISTYGEHHADTPAQNLRHSADRQWLHRKIFAVSLDGKATVRSIAYANSDALSYWAEPHATVNRDFTRLLFNSTWNGSNARDMDAFMAAIPQNALNTQAR